MSASTTWALVAALWSGFVVEPGIPGWPETVGDATSHAPQPVSDPPASTPDPGEVNVPAPLLPTSEPPAPDSNTQPGTEAEPPPRPPPPKPGELNEVFWVTVEAGVAEVVGTTFGIGGRRLLALNPELKRNGVIPAGTRVRVFRHDPKRPTQSIGAPNRGRLINGIPLPEGPNWRLRDNRRRTFGTHLAISSLLQAFRQFGARYPDGPDIRIGELSRRKGGRIRPHNSHRTGRDIDIGYLHTTQPVDRKWVRTTSKNFDVQKNWDLVRVILETGVVQSIYMSARIQRRLYREAKRQGVTQEVLDRYFQHPRRPGSEHAIVRHSRGHHNHLHVRFVCEPWNPRCRALSRSRKPRRS